MNFKAYIKRIKYSGELVVSLDTLKGLQNAHLLHIPFENLDIHYNNPITLDLDHIYQKIIVNNRGGFCYELNSLFEHFLQSLGFETKIISARVFDSNKEIFGEEYDHLAIIVTLDQGEYLVDVGFGEFVFHPLKLELNAVQSDHRGDFIIEAHDKAYYKVSKLELKDNTIEYIFTVQKRALNEFEHMCHYHQTHEASHFTQKKLISKPTENGRITLTGNTLKITEDGVLKVNQAFKHEDYQYQLFKWFDIDLSKVKSAM